jgi:hypothetical protein
MVVQIALLVVLAFVFWALEPRDRRKRDVDPGCDFDIDDDAQGTTGHGHHDVAGHDSGGHDFGGHDFGGHDFGGHDFGGHDFGDHDFSGHD